MAGDLCPACKRAIELRDWTCPYCGRIFDRFLFNTLSIRTIAEWDKGAFQAGHEACMARWKSTGSTELGEYRPVRGHETAYRAGWQCAADQVERRAERKRGRRRGLALLGTGTLFSAVGLPLAVISFRHGAGERFLYMPLGIGLLNLTFGIVAVISGHCDE
jgi:hypothetical protein